MLLMQGAQVQFLVGDLRFHVLSGAAKKLKIIKKRVREGKKKCPVSIKVYVTMVGRGLGENDAFSVFIMQMMASVFFPAPVHLR